MTDLADLGDFDPAHAAVNDPAPPTIQLSRAEKAAIILGILGTETATPILEQLDEHCHRAFANAMARLERIDAETGAAVIGEFIAELETNEMTLTGGIDRAREMLQEFVEAKALEQILDEADRPTARNVWDKLVKVDESALTDLLATEHPQTAAVIVNRLAPDKAAAILSRLDADTACRIILGVKQAARLSPDVVHAIGQSVSRDFLSVHRPGERRRTPADRIGAIMNYAAGEMRENVLGFLGRVEPELLADVRRRMFTFEDIPTRIEKRDITAIVRATPNEVLLPALAGAAENAKTSRDFILANISSRVAEQIREELDEMGAIKLRAAEEAQTEIIRTIRNLQTEGVLKLIEVDD